LEAVEGHFCSDCVWEDGKMRLETRSMVVALVEPGPKVGTFRISAGRASGA
jgi:hypothetical protein